MSYLQTLIFGRNLKIQLTWVRNAWLYKVIFNIIFCLVNIHNSLINEQKKKPDFGSTKCILYDTGSYLNNY